MIEVLKVRRVGNSNVLSIPRRIAECGYDAGQPVIMEVQENGDLLIRRITSRAELVQAAGMAFAEKHRGALERLAAHEPEEAARSAGSR